MKKVKKSKRWGSEWTREKNRQERGTPAPRRVGPLQGLSTEVQYSLDLCPQYSCWEQRLQFASSQSRVCVPVSKLPKWKLQSPDCRSKERSPVRYLGAGGLACIE